MFPLKDSIPHRNTPFVNYLLIAINIFVFFYEISLPKYQLEQLFFEYGLVPARYSYPFWALYTGLNPNNYLPFLTNIFFHGGWLHLISNMWALYIFGDNVEDRMGHIRYLIFYLLCGVGANLCHFYLNYNSAIPTVGASGAIAGVMGAYLILFPHSKIITFFPLFFIPYFFEIPAIFYLTAWFLYQLFSGLFSLSSPHFTSNIAFFAHIGGFIVGIILLPLFKNKNYRDWYEDEFYFNMYFKE